jgi:hypothetical protein
MIINSVSETAFTANQKAIIVNGKRLIPRSQYKGPILELTKEEETEIKALRERLAEIAVKRLELEKYYRNSDVAINQRNYYDNAFMKLDWECDMLLDKIEKIQKNRHNHQLKQMRK